jgi:hypothetical protein
VTASSFQGPRFSPYPPWLPRTVTARRRWDRAAAIIEHLSRQMEPDGEADARFCWIGVRALYRTEWDWEAEWRESRCVAGDSDRGA